MVRIPMQQEITIHLFLDSNYPIQYRKFFGIREKGAVQRILHTSTCSESYPHSKGNQRNTEELIDMYYMLCIVGIQKYHAHTAYGMLSLCRKYAVYQLEPSFPIFSSEEGRRRADNKIPKPGTRKMKTVNSLSTQFTASFIFEIDLSYTTSNLGKRSMTIMVILEIV